MIPATLFRSTPARSLRSALVMGLGLVGLAFLAACASPGPAEHYPKLSQMPSLPQGVTPSAERQRIIQELEKDEVPTADQPARKRPAVPPKPAPTEQPTGALVPADGALIEACEMDLPAAKPVRLAQAAVPPLRGTLHGSWHAAPATAPPTAPAPMVANPPEGTGITGSVAVPAQTGPLVIGFTPGSAMLSPRDVAVLKARADSYILNGGTGVRIGARGGARGLAQPLATLSLSMKRTSAIADVLIKAGIGAEQIKMAAAGDRTIPALGTQGWKGAGPDDAVVIFDIPTP